jgi:hypothetical protein
MIRTNGVVCGYRLFLLLRICVLDYFLLAAFGDLKEDEKNWWINRKLEARMHHGRRFWAWELEPPRTHPIWYNRSAKKELFRWGLEGMHDLNAFELVPRPIMANWWCPTPCGTLNLSRKKDSTFSSIFRNRHIICLFWFLGTLQIHLLLSVSHQMDPGSTYAASASNFQLPLPAPQ